MLQWRRPLKNKNANATTEGSAVDTFTLENDSLRLEFSRQNGALVGLSSIASGWQMLDRPSLGLSFRLLLPLPERRDNPVFGEQQTLAALDVVDPRHARLTWD